MYLFLISSIYNLCKKRKKAGGDDVNQPSERLIITISETLAPPSLTMKHLKKEKKQEEGLSITELPKQLPCLLVQVFAIRQKSGFEPSNDRDLQVIALQLIIPSLQPIALTGFGDSCVRTWRDFRVFITCASNPRSTALDNVEPESSAFVVEGCRLMCPTFW